MPLNQPPTYQELPYPELSFPRTLPRRLGALAWLRGMGPVEPSRARVLEVGCATGANLIPMASVEPEAHFVGIDQDGAAIARGRSLIEAVGLQNIRLEEVDLQEAALPEGAWDYVIVHGVYSWVPPAVQDALLERISTWLAPDGLAYVSYTTFPGWHYRQAGVDFLLEMCRDTSGIQQLRTIQATAARLLHPLAEWDDPRLQLLARQLHQTAAQHPALLAHGDFGRVHLPLYFRTFHERAVASGLQYVGDARIRWVPPNHADLTGLGLAASILADEVAREQVMDFLESRAFRRSVLCRSTVELAGRPQPERLDELYCVGSATLADEGGDLSILHEETFVGADGAMAQISDPLTRAALRVLSHPGVPSIPFARLLEMARGLLQEHGGAIPTEEEHRRFRRHLLHLYGDDLVDLELFPPACIPHPPTRPLVSPLVREMARRGHRVTNQRHQTLQVDDITRLVLGHLDGTRDGEALLQLVVDVIGDGDLVLERDGEPVPNSECIPFLAHQLQHLVPRLGQAGFLIPQAG